MTKPEIIAAIDERINTQRLSIPEMEGKRQWLELYTVLVNDVKFLTTLKSQIQELKTVDND